MVAEKGESRNMQDVEAALAQLMELFEVFKSTRGTNSKKICFWEEYMSMVNILLHFIKAERKSNWQLHLTAVAAMLPHFFAIDRQNYPGGSQFT